MVVLQPVSTVTLSGLPSEEGRLIYDSTTKTLKYNNGVVDTELTSDTLAGPVGINTSNPDRTLEISDATGQVLRLTYNDDDGSAVNYVDFDVSSGGDLTINASGNDILTGTSDNFDIQSHNGSTIGLKLGGTLVTATAAELNYVDTTAGTAAASKALILDGSLNIAGINSLSATDLTGELQTAAQPNLTSVGTLTALDVSGNLDLTGHNGTTVGLELAGVLVTSTAAEINYLDGVTPGTAVVSKAVVLDSNGDFVGVNAFSATEITGELQTAAQPNITSVGTLTGLSITNSLSLTGTNATGNTVLNVATVTRQTTNTPANGLGVGVDFAIENDANVNTVYGTINVSALDITDNSEDGKFSIGLMNAGTMVNNLFTLKNDGEISATRLVESSDRRIKTDIEDADEDDSLDKIMNLKIKNWRYIKSPEVLHRGVIAQELKEVIPSAVTISQREELDDFHSISNSEMLSYLIHAVQVINKKFDSANSC